ncbi:MAG: glycosyltransferase family 4 protein [bacterium]|nr:glycosyltransferase family 4 protein [bacterium]
MKLIYFTSMRYPADNGMKIYARELAKEFTKVLKEKFIFVVANNFSDELKDINCLNLALKIKKFRSPFFFFWIPYFVFISRKEKDLVFFSNDTFLLTFLIFWKKFLRFNYRICSDWHHLHYNKKEKFIIRNSDALITTSRRLKDDLIKLGEVPGDNIFFAYGGVNLNIYNDTFFSNQASLGLPEGKNLIGYIGYFKTFGLEKGIPTMIRALALLSDEFAMAFVGGKNDEIREYTELAKAHGVEARCFFFGVKKGDEVAQYQMSMDIIAIPYPDQPGFGYPMKVYEYMASRRPIIYSKLGLVEEVIGDCAYPFIPGDSSSFAEAVLKIANNKKEADKHVLQAYEKVKGYSWESKAIKITDFLTK